MNYPEHTEYYINKVSREITGHGTEEAIAALAEHAPETAKQLNELVDTLEYIEAELREEAYPEVDYQIAPQFNLAEENAEPELGEAKRILGLAAMYLPKK